MTSQEIADAVLAWARETVPDLAGGYDHIPLESIEPLPDVVVDVASSGTTQESRLFAMFDLQQAWVYQWVVELSLMVDNGNPAEAASQLRGFESRMTSSLMRDGTLGNRVPFISPFFSYDYTPPFVERADGTKGREMTMSLVVGERVLGP